MKSNESIPAARANTQGADTELVDEDVADVAGSAEDNGGTERVIRAWIFTGGKLTGREFSSVKELNWNPKKGVLWLDLSQYENEDLRDLAAQLELDQAGVNAALAPWQRPSVAAFANHAFVNASVLQLDLDELRVSANEIDCFLGDRFVLTAHNQELPFIDNVVARAEINVEMVTNDAAYLLYILLDELINDFAANQEHLDAMIEDQENQALNGTAGEAFLDELVRRKRFVYAANRFVTEHGFIFHGLLRPDFPFVSGEPMEGYFAELSSRFTAVATAFAGARQEILGTFEIYMSSVAHRTNRIMKTLTIISILVLPATAIFGFFGTNFVQLPFFGTAGFIAMLLMLFLLTAGQLMLFRTRGWLA
jgi:magnesium transporter